MSVSKKSFLSKLETLKNAYTQALKQKFLTAFITKFEFKGDKDFTPQKQRLMFASLFLYGNAAVSPLGTGQAGTRFAKAIWYSNPVKWTVDRLPKEAHLILANQGLPGDYGRSKNLTKQAKFEDTVFLTYDQFFYTIPFRTISPIIEQVADMLISVSRAQNFSLPKIIMKNFPNDYEEAFQTFTNDVYNPDNIFVRLQIDETDIAFNQTNLMTPALISNKIANIKELLALISQILGIRARLSEKKERVIEMEVSQDEQEFSASEHNMRITLDQFMKDYKRVFNKKLTLTENKPEVMFDLQKPESAQAEAVAPAEGEEKNE